MSEKDVPDYARVVVIGGGISDDLNLFGTDVTSSYGQLNVQGPESRQLLQ